MKNEPAASILFTKLYKPRVPEKYLHRDFLLERLEKWIHRPMTLVCAPAGYGKSTLLSSWLDRSDTPGAWISLGETENDVTLFLSYMTAAVHSLFPGAVQTTRNLLPETPPAKPEDLTNSFINELDRIDQTFILVLDDYHIIHDKEVHGLISTLVKYPPRPLHLVMASRLDPPLGLSRLRARRQMGELRGQDLRLSLKETQAFFKNDLGLTINQFAVATLNDKLEGWVTGLRLTSLLLKDKSNRNRRILSLPADNRYITSYLLSEVLHSLPEHIYSFLLSTSILNRFNASLCDAVCPPDMGSLECGMGGTNFINWLKSSELFVISLDEQGTWFRYHHLFQMLLLGRLKQQVPQEKIVELQMQASQWFAANDFIDEALDYALAANQGVKAAQMVEENRHLPLNQDKWFALEAWLNKLPKNIIEQRPHLLMARVWVLNFRFDLASIPPVLEKIKALCPDGVPQDIEVEMGLFKGIFLFWEGKSQDSMSLMESVLQKLAENHIGARNEALIYLAVASQSAGQGEKIVKQYQNMLIHDRPGGTYKLRLLASLAFVQLLSGKLDRAGRAVSSLIKTAGKQKNRHIEGWGLYLRGVVDYQAGRLEMAVQCFSNALQKAFSLDANMNMDCYAGLILSYQSMDQPEKANESVKKMMTFARKTGNLECIHLAGSIEARLLLLQGNLKKAVDWQANTDFSSDTGHMLFWLDLPRTNQCRILIARGSEPGLKQAAKRLDTDAAFNIKTCNTPQMMEIFFLQAWLYQKQEQNKKAVQVLDQALDLACKGGYIHSIVRHMPRIKDLLPRTSLYGDAKALLDHRPVIPGNTATQENLADGQVKVPPIAKAFEPANPLTRRENEILSNVSRGLSNKEVASRLYISPETVKKHTINIYQKLGVHNRQQAALKAKDMGLI